MHSVSIVNIRPIRINVISFSFRVTCCITKHVIRSIIIMKLILGIRMDVVHRQCGIQQRNNVSVSLIPALLIKEHVWWFLNNVWVLLNWRSSFDLVFKTLSIAQYFIVVRPLRPVHWITAPYEQKYTSFQLVRG